MKNYIRKNLILNNKVKNVINMEKYPSLKNIIFKELLNVELQFNSVNKIDYITFFDNIKIKTDYGYWLSNIIIKNNQLKVEYKNEYESILKVFEIKNNNILYKCENKIIVKPKNEWICNNKLTIPQCNSIYNLEIDGNDSNIFEELDLRNVKKINKIKFKNCTSLKKIIINDPSKQDIIMNFYDNSLNNILNINKIILVIENKKIVNSFGNKKIELEFNKHNLTELLSINTIKNEYIIKYGEYDNIKNINEIYLKITPDLKIFKCNNDQEVLITQDKFNIDKHVYNETNSSNYFKKHYIINMETHEKLLEKNNCKLIKKR